VPPFLEYAARDERIGCTARLATIGAGRDIRAHLSRILDLLAEDDSLNVYAGEREVRPPAAPTTRPGLANAASHPLGVLNRRWPSLPAALLSSDGRQAAEFRVTFA